jgi:F0F1-type ATP synthase delta subunit
VTQANPQLLEVFRHPTIPHEQKRAVLNELIRARARATDHGQLPEGAPSESQARDLSEVNRQFAQELDRRSNVVTAQVTTARPLPRDAQESLRAKLLADDGPQRAARVRG